MALVPEIQKINAMVDHYVCEIHSMQTVGPTNPIGERQSIAFYMKEEDAFAVTSDAAFRSKIMDRNPWTIPLNCS
jgi:hypothetical protein